jgi:hypothetical protein
MGWAQKEVKMPAMKRGCHLVTHLVGTPCTEQQQQQQQQQNNQQQHVSGWAEALRTPIQQSITDKMLFLWCR